MEWLIQCANGCGKQTAAGNIVELIAEHRDAEGWFVCPCGSRGYIEKRFSLKQGGVPWEPFLRGIISLAGSGDSYHPFVFLVSAAANGEVTDIWFSYYKDLRASGGRLQVGYGPGGPPVMRKPAVLLLMKHLVNTRFLSLGELTATGNAV